MFKSRISAGATEKLPSSENPSVSTRSYDMERPCHEVCETILRIGEQNLWDVYWCFMSVHGWIHACLALNGS